MPAPHQPATLDSLLLDSAVSQKKGQHFTLAAVLIWIAVLAIHMTDLPILTKNLYTFFCTAPLMPLAWSISRLINVDFTNKSNPLTKLGLLFSMNQMLYLPIVMWVFPTVPDQMLMVLAMVFGAHLLPYGWLYSSRTYTVSAVIIPIAVLIVGVSYPPAAVAVTMLAVMVVFNAMLHLEVRNLPARG